MIVTQRWQFEEPTFWLTVETIIAISLVSFLLGCVWGIIVQRWFKSL